MKKTKTGFITFLLGGTIGAIVGLLYAPQSGEETRQFLSDKRRVIANETVTSIKEAQNTAMATIQEAQKRLETLNQEAKERLVKLQEIAKHTAQEQKESLVKGYSEAREVVTE
jgi:gas vesicle protein